MDSKNILTIYHIFAPKIWRPIFFNFSGRGQPLFSNFHSMGLPIIKIRGGGGDENISGTALIRFFLIVLEGKILYLKTGFDIL